MVVEEHVVTVPSLRRYMVMAYIAGFILIALLVVAALTGSLVILFITVAISAMCFFTAGYLLHNLIHGQYTITHTGGKW